MQEAQTLVGDDALQQRLSDHSRTKEELRSKTAILEAQLDASIDGILVVDLQRRKILQNQRCIDLWKIPPEIMAKGDVAQVDFVMGRTKDPKQFVEKVVYLYEHPRESSRDEIELVDGMILDRYSAPVRDKEGEIYGRIWTFRDITEKRASRIALQKSEERFKILARATSDAIWDWDVTTGTVWRNDNYATLFGIGSTDLGKEDSTWSSRIHLDDRDRVLASLQASLDGEAQTWFEEYRFHRLDGSVMSVEDHAHIMRGTDGRAFRVVGGVSDVTRKNEVEAQQLRSQRFESIGTLAGGMAHDLNNVLTPVLVAVELLRTTIGSNRDQLTLVDTIESNTRRGADLVRQVLTYARGSSGERKSVNLKELFLGMESMIRETFPRKIRIAMNVPDGLWPVVGDPTQLHQVLINLAVNARDALPGEGEISFSASNVVLDGEFASAKGSTEALPFVVLTVADSGAGIPPDIRDRIFEPFFTTKDVGSGSGLGLSTVQGIVKSHGGTVRVSSKVGFGSTFEVRLPAAPGTRAERPQPATPGLSLGRGELVLVVDDEPSVSGIVALMLETYGYRVLTASDGARATALYAQHAHEIAVVITDMMMPIMDGHATIEAIKRINPAAKIIAVSGIAETGSPARAANAGAKDFLAKPYSTFTILPLVRTVIDRPASP